MGTYGREVFSARFGTSVKVCMSGMVGRRSGEIDWDTVQPAVTNMVFPDDVHIKAGERYLRYGTVLAKITEGSSAGKFGPADPDATDGRQHLNRGSSYILDETLIESDGAQPIMFEGGRVYKERLLLDGPGCPSLREFEVAFPGVTYV